MVTNAQQMADQDDICNLEVELVSRIEQATHLLDIISHVKIEGINKLRNKIKQESAFLTKIRQAGTFKKDHLICSNLKHLEAVAAELVKNEAICSGVMVNQSLTDEYGSQKKLCVDMILHQGRVWLKIVARNPKALTLVSAGEGYYGQRSIIEQASEFLECAKQHPQFYEPPTVCFCFAQGIECELSEELKSLGIAVVDASIGGHDFQKLFVPQYPVSTSSVDDVTNTRLNLCVSTMLAYVSALTNGGAHYRFVNHVLTEHAYWEQQRPVKPILDRLFLGRELFCCRTAYDNFREIVRTLGGPNEKVRADEFLKRVVVVDDYFSERLEAGGNVKQRSLSIFGTGEYLKAVTVTANHAFVRSSESKGVNFVVFLHESRPLTEGKQLDPT